MHPPLVIEPVWSGKILESGDAVDRFAVPSVARDYDALVVCQDSFEGLGTDNFGFWILDFGNCPIPHFKIDRPVALDIATG